MKIGIIVDGQAESQALRFITEKIKVEGKQILSPVYADLQPRATPHQIVRSAYGKIEILNSKKVNQIVLLIDCDDRRECPVAFANSINQAINDMNLANIVAVVKNRCFENWLIADPAGLAKMAARFHVTEGFVNTVSNNKADNVRDAEGLINRIILKSKYRKGVDSIEMSRHVNPDSVALNSRSFRKFLHALGHSPFNKQSKCPM